jgi:hypothetical protein
VERIVIVEGLLTTVGDDGDVNIAAMGAVCADPETLDAGSQLCLKPFRTSRTYVNLARTGQGVFHTVDDVGLLVGAVTGRFDRQPRLIPASGVEGHILGGACSWYALRVASSAQDEQRATLQCRIVGRGTLGPWRGWNRARHAILEAAILATRVHLLPVSEIEREFARLRIPVDKTGGAAEHRALQTLSDFVRERQAGAC